MNIQQIADYEASLQFALGDILRDLTILMHCAEQEQWLDDATYLQTLTHLKTFQNRLNALEQDVRSIYGSTCNLDNDTDEIILSWSSVEKGREGQIFSCIPFDEYRFAFKDLGLITCYPASDNTAPTLEWWTWIFTRTQKT